MNGISSSISIVYYYYHNNRTEATRCMIDLFMDIRFESVRFRCRCGEVNTVLQKLFHHSIFLGMPVCSDITFLIHQPSSLLVKKLDTVFSRKVLLISFDWRVFPPIPSNSCPYILEIKDVLFNFQCAPQAYKTKTDFIPALNSFTIKDFSF